MSACAVRFIQSDSGRDPSSLPVIHVIWSAPTSAWRLVQPSEGEEGSLIRGEAGQVGRRPSVVRAKSSPSERPGARQISKKTSMRDPSYKHRGGNPGLCFAHLAGVGTSTDQLNRDRKGRRSGIACYAPDRQCPFTSRGSSQTMLPRSTTKEQMLASVESDLRGACHVHPVPGDARRDPTATEKTQ